MSGNFEYSSASELFKAAICKAFEKKTARVAASLIMIPAAVFCISELHSGWYMLSDTWLSYLLTVLLYGVVMLGGGILVSCVGSFKRWKFITGASVSAILLWGAVTFLGVWTTLYVSTEDELPDCIIRLLQHTAPMLLLALCAVIIAGALFTRVKKEKGVAGHSGI